MERLECVDEVTKEFLLKKEKRIKNVVHDAYTLIGKELKEAQQTLAKNGYGCFQEWVRTCLGIGVNKAYGLIHRYEFINKNPTIADYLESLPVSLLYEITKPSVEMSELRLKAKNAVLKGEVRTLKAFKDLIKTVETKASRSESKAVIDKLTKDIKSRSIVVPAKSTAHLS
ncbi:hypothetical protein [Bacillus sp. Bos-x628]|uniref:hypothetical protein n=1 Tax=Bacillus maqinnsis TaxID=3229854 RepID=UPI00338FD5F9